MSIPLHRLTGRQQDDIREFLEDNGNRSEWRDRTPESLSPRELLDAWLSWNGIHGYTDQILSVVGKAFNLETWFQEGQ